MLWDGLEGWDGGGRGDPEGGDVCIRTADSLYYAGENNTTL